MKNFDRLEAYLDSQGRVQIWPSKRNRHQLQILVLEYLLTKFAVNEVYTEKQVNAILNEYHNFADPALLRREMVEKGLLVRKKDCSAYWCNQDRN